jgi:hypothetical protein
VDETVKQSTVKRRVGDGTPGPGRPKGIPNRSTTNAREALARFVDNNADRLQGWLDEIAETQGPMAAFRCWADVVEYHIPKLARTEHVGDGGGPVASTVTLDVSKLSSTSLAEILAARDADAS